MPNRLELKFPKGFLWGAVTSAHQVEGNQHNQWSVWELENAKSLAAQAPYQYDDLDNWSSIKQQALSPQNYVSRRAVNHYELYAKDIELAHRMNMNALRLSIEWSRIQPERDAWDAEAISHYRDVIDEMKSRGIEPVVTLFHFTLPIWFGELGGFEKRGNMKYFVDFSRRILKEFGPIVRYVITFNEPETYAVESYYRGQWPPQLQSRAKTLNVLHNMAWAHNKIAQALHETSRRYKVSIAKRSTYVYPGDDSWLSVRTAAILQYANDDYFLRRVVKHCDFLGVNFFSGTRVYGYRVHNPENQLSDTGVELQPELIERDLERLYEKYRKPLMVTGGGIADSDDRYRQRWLMQTIIALQRLRNSGVGVIGYLYTSLLDGFEWEKGYWPQYGLISVDRRTMERRLRPSAIWFAKVLRKVRQ